MRVSCIELDVVALDCEPVKEGAMRPAKELLFGTTRWAATANHVVHLHARHDDHIRAQRKEIGGPAIYLPDEVSHLRVDATEVLTQISSLCRIELAGALWLLSGLARLLGWSV